MSTMHEAVRRLVAATEARLAAHEQAVALHLQDRPAVTRLPADTPPAGPAFPIPAQGGGGDGSDTRHH